MKTLLKASLAIAIALVTVYKAQTVLADAPYPLSPVITSLTWAPSSTIDRKATGSDTWPITWADDGHLYTAYGDGKGFVPKVPSKLSLGFAKVSGVPNTHVGVNIRSSNEQGGSGSSGKKGSGMLMVDGVLYMWVRNANQSGQQCELWYSTNYGVDWIDVGWNFEEFGYCTFINYGKNYAGARDDYVYTVSHDHPSAYKVANDFVLLRCVKTGLTVEENWEFFVGLDENGYPLWSSDIAERGPVFTNTGNCRRSGISYNSYLERYFWWQQNGVEVDTRFSGGFGIYDAPEPWGPWTTVFYTESWDVGPGETGSFPTKWMSDDGKTMYLLFSGDDAFSVRKATLTVATFWDDATAPSVPTDLTAIAFSNSQINLSWEASTDPESGVARYNIYRNSIKAGTAAGTNYSDVDLSDGTTYIYQIAAVNGANLESDKCASVSATTLADTTPPEITSVSASGDSTSVIVVFGEPVEESSAIDVTNYTIDQGMTIYGASLGADLKTVTLTTSAHSEALTYTLTVSNVRDCASTPNVIAANTQVTYDFVAQVVISNLSVASGKAYEIMDNGLENGALLYIDRNYAYKSVPAWLEGATYIKTANDDKSSSGDIFVTFDVNQDVTVYVAHDNRITTKPSWMSSFTDTGVDILANITLSVFEKQFPTGSVTLGGNAGSAYNMFSVIIVGQDSGAPPSDLPPAPPKGLTITLPN